MFVLQVQGKPVVITIATESDFDDFNIPSFSYLLKDETDLEKVPSSAMVAVYNAINPEATITKFDDRETAQATVAPLILQLAADRLANPPAPSTEMETDVKKTTKKAKTAPKEKKPKAPKVPKVKKEKGPGVISTFYDLAKRGEGVTYEEAGKALKKAFHDREEDSMIRTCRINISPANVKRIAPGWAFKKDKDEKRGWVYKLRKA